jgi:hypothetical protein
MSIALAMFLCGKSPAEAFFRRLGHAWAVFVLSKKEVLSVSILLNTVFFTAI